MANNKPKREIYIPIAKKFMLSLFSPQKICVANIIDINPIMTPQAR